MLDNVLPQQTIRYLSQVLGDDAVRAAPSAQAAQLPYFLQDTYAILQGELLGHPVAFACVKGAQALGGKQLDLHAQRLRELLGTPVILALPALAPGERKQLIQRGIAFVVPDRQLFAPQLGVILSERFASAPRRAQAIASPATQALLIRFLNQHQDSETWHPFEEAAALGYAAMTATRAIRELLAFNLFALDVRGRAKHLKQLGTRRELWEAAKPYLRSPVVKTLWTYDRRILEVSGALWAGESALAHMTMINAPQQPVFAMTAEAAQAAKQAGIFFEPRELADGLAVEVWRYVLSMQATEKTVDPLSLWLSLRDKQDDRIQLALDEMEEKFPW